MPIPTRPEPDRKRKLRTAGDRFMRSLSFLADCLRLRPVVA
jgi:hypothetical protein